MFRRVLLASALLLSAIPAAQAQLGGILSAPATLIERAVEARSTSDIVEDNRIDAAVNAAMAKVGTIKASTEIYEQRLLITGIFSDKASYDSFQAKVKEVKGIKKLYWHVILMSEDEQKKAKLLSWDQVLEMNTKAKARLVGTAGVADVNFRITTDPTGTVYLLGRARSAEEGKKALARAQDGNGVKKVVNYVEVRP